MAYADDLVTIRTNLVTAIAAMMSSPKPSYSNGERSVSWAEYRRQLMSELEQINKLIAQSDPTEIVTLVRPV